MKKTKNLRWRLESNFHLFRNLANIFFPPTDEHIHIIEQRPVETKEFHCTATYGCKSVIFQWIVTREMVTLEDFKKKLCEYLTFPDGHIVIGRVIGGACLERKISTGKMRKKLDQASSSSQSATVESDTVEIATERKVIKFSADGIY